MRHHISLRRLPQVESLEARDNPGNAFGNFFGGLVGRVEVLTYYGVGAVKGVFEHGPAEHAQTPKQHRQQRAFEIALASAKSVGATVVSPATVTQPTKPLLTFRPSA